MSELSREQVEIYLEWSRNMDCWTCATPNPESAAVVLIEPEQLEALSLMALRALSQPPDSEAERLLIAKLTGISAHIWAVSAYDKLHGDADVIDEVIAHLSRQPAAQPERRKGERRKEDASERRDDNGQLLPFRFHDAEGRRCSTWYDQRKADRRQPAAREPERQFLPAMDRELEWILGRPNFACVSFARALEKSGQTIEHKAEAEAEQAAAIYWMLGLYLKHGAEKWRDEAEAAMTAMLRASEPTEGGA